MNIFLTKRAKKNYHSIKEFIAEEWGENVSAAFEQKKKDFFDLLERFPELGELEVFDKKSVVFNSQGKQEYFIE